MTNTVTYFSGKAYHNEILYDREAVEELILLVILHVYINNNLFNIFINSNIKINKEYW